MIIKTLPNKPSVEDILSQAKSYYKEAESRHQRGEKQAAKTILTLAVHMLERSRGLNLTPSQRREVEHQISRCTQLLHSDEVSHEIRTWQPPVLS